MMNINQFAFDGDVARIPVASNQIKYKGMWLWLQAPSAVCGYSKPSLIEHVEFVVNHEIVECFSGAALKMLETFDVRAAPSFHRAGDPDGDPGDDDPGAVVTAVIPLMIRHVVPRGANVTVIVRTAPDVNVKKLLVESKEFTQTLYNIALHTRKTSRQHVISDAEAASGVVHLTFPSTTAVRDVLLTVSGDGSDATSGEVVQWLEFGSPLGQLTQQLTRRLDTATLRALSKRYYESDFCSVYYESKARMYAFAFDTKPLANQPKGAMYTQGAWLDVGVSADSAGRTVDVLFRHI
jgi:hypothetical protein